MFTPSKKIPFYSKETKTVKVNIYQKDILVNEIKVNADKGYNEVVFDVSFSKTGRKDFEKSNKDPKLKAAQNGVYYLPKGKYTVKVGESSNTFIVK